jgi:hypothetical protein
MPRAKLTPTEKQHQTARALSAYGIEPVDIALYMGIAEKTHQKYFGEDMFRARVEANAKVGKTMFEMASCGVYPAATIFWSKTRGGFRELKNAAAPPPAVIPNFVVNLEKKAA